MLLLVIALSTAGQVTIAGTNSQVTTNPAAQLDPAISGDLVVYTDQRNGNDDVFYTDLATSIETQVTSSTAPQRLHDVSGGTIVYTDLTPPVARIFAYDTATATASAVSAGSDQNARIDGQIVAFERGPPSNLDIVAVDLATNTEIVVASTLSIEQSPSVSGTRVVYERHAVAGAPGDIVMFDLATNSETVIAGTAADERRPDIDGDIIVWDVDNGTDLDIALHDLSTNTTTVVAAAGNQRLPHVSGDLIAFDDDSAGNPDVALYDIPSGTVSPVATDASADFLNDIDGHRVVYTSNQSGNLDIWLYQFTVTRDDGGGDGCPDASTDLCADETGYGAVYSETFTRSRGAPVTETRTFAAAPGTTGTIVVHNNGCASAVATLNGESVIVPSDLNMDVTCFTREVTLAADNTVSVEVRSAPGCSIDVSFDVEEPCTGGITTLSTAASCASTSPSTLSVVALAMMGFALRRRKRR